jgi:ATP-dependent helicase HrpA
MGCSLDRDEGGYVVVFDIKYDDALPINNERARIIQTIQENQVVIIAGATGSGKTTQLPKMCLDAGFGRKKMIGCTQPRRIAATSIAERVAHELGELGSLVGYKIRFGANITPQTRIKFMTDGILLAEAQGDPLLRGYDVIIIDEAHERSLNIDFLLGLLQNIIRKRPDLKVIITSATIDTMKFARVFHNAPIIEVSGRTYPVDIRYVDDGDGDDYVEAAVAQVLSLIRKEGAGDMLVFMPTELDIRECVTLLEKKVAHGGVPASCEILPLFGRLAGKAQNRVFRTSPHMKIVVATNVAETSLTVPGIKYVVDTGLARILSYNARAKTTKLPVTRISRASCDQRAGRCGRVGPGICVRLFSADDYLDRSEYTLPEILRSNLADVILRMTHLGLGDPAKFPFVDSPSSVAIQDGYKLLSELQAIRRDRTLTKSGKVMARLPLDPRLACMILTARGENCLTEMTIVAAALSIQDPRVRPPEKQQQADEAHKAFTSKVSDFETYLLLWQKYQEVAGPSGSQNKARKYCKEHFLSFQRMREWRDIHHQIEQILRQEHGNKQTPLRFVKNASPAPLDAVHRAILSGNLRHIGMRKDKNFYLGAYQKELMLFPGSCVFGKGGGWIMAGELVETSRLYARNVATIKPEWIEPLALHLCKKTYSSPSWRKKQGIVTVKEQVSLFGLVIVAGRFVNFGPLNPLEAREIFIQSALVEGNLGGHYTFLTKNIELLARLEELEHRTRKRGVVADDMQIFDFYASRIPADVFDRGSLNRLLKQQGGDDGLVMEEKHVLRELPDAQTLDDFPSALACGELTFNLKYCFDPGQKGDGIGVVIPKNLAAHARSDMFDWLVPGLLLEKIIVLLKGLPKSIRRNLVPIPQAAEKIKGHLVPYQSNLFRQLEDAIHQEFNLTVQPSMWNTDNLPKHLQMRYELTGDAQVETSRNRAILHADHGEYQLENKELVDLRHQYEKQDVSPQDFASLPERWPIHDGKGSLVGFGYPGLQSQSSGSVSLVIFTDVEKCRGATKEGLLVLYRSHFMKNLTPFKKDFGLPRSHWGLYEGVASHEEMNSQIFNYILMEIFGCREGIIPSDREFAAVLARVKAEGVYVLGQELLGQIIRLLQERRASLDVIASLEGQSRGKSNFGVTPEECAALRKEVGLFFPENFLETMDKSKLANIPRYFKGMVIRFERCIHDPAKDKKKMQEVQPFIDLLRQGQEKAALSPAAKAGLGEFQSMIEEFKISIFAQELKTVFPISAKRLEKKWQEIRLQLR